MEACNDIDSLASRLRAEAKKHTGGLKADLTEAAKIVDWYCAVLHEYHRIRQAYREAERWRDEAPCI